MNSLLELDGKDLDDEINRISKENPPRAKKWTEKETAILRKLKGRGVSCSKIAKLLDRTYESVEAKSGRI